MDYTELDRQISEILNLGEESVYILKPNKHGDSLKFTYPDRLSGNLIPINAQSTAGRAAVTKRPYVSNNVQGERDAIFLNCLIRNYVTASIQKMINYPILLAGDVIAILQVIRKGDTLVEDFQKEDLEKIKSVVDDMLFIYLVKSA